MPLFIPGPEARQQAQLRILLAVYDRSFAVGFVEARSGKLRGYLGFQCPDHARQFGETALVELGPTASAKSLAPGSPFAR